MAGRVSPILPISASVATLVVTVGVGAVAGCAGSGQTESGRLRVAATVAPLASIVSEVGGNRVEVAETIPEGVDSHTFEPRPSTSATLSRAALIFVNGLGLEDPTSRLAREVKPEGSRIVELGNRTLPRGQWMFDRSFPRSEGSPNPHLWTSPPRALAYARVVRDELAAASPKSAAYFRARFRNFSERVGRLDRVSRRAFATIPPDRRVLLTHHDGFAYFARDYGFRVVGAVQAADFRDPTPREVRAIVDQVRSERVPAVFGAEAYPSKVLQQIASETGSLYVGELRDDDLPGDAGDPDHSWLGLMRANFIALTEALGGDASALRSYRARAAAGAPESGSSR